MLDLIRSVGAQAMCADATPGHLTWDELMTYMTDFVSWDKETVKANTCKELDTYPEKCTCPRHTDTTDKTPGVMTWDELLTFMTDVKGYSAESLNHGNHRLDDEPFQWKACWTRSRR